MQRFRSSNSLDGYSTRPHWITKNGISVPTYPTTSPDYDYPLVYKEIFDVNNGRLRPNSPCVVGRVTTSPVLIPYTGTLPGNPQLFGALDVPPLELLRWVRFACKPTTDDHYRSLLKHMQKQRSKIVGEFSSLNLLYELREVGSLLKEANGKWRRLNSYRPIDYLFGVRPMVSDLLAALTQYNSVASRYAEIVKKYRSYPVNGRRRGRFDNNGVTTYFGQNVHHQDNAISIESVLKGTLSLGFPLLAQVNPELFVLLEQAAIDPSASNAWNAIPFSWLLDWFLPFGDYLSSLPTLMKPECYFYGTISHKLRGHHVTESRYSGPAYLFPNGAAGSSFATTSYTRIPFNGPTTGLISWDITQGLNSIEKMAILRDIFSPPSKHSAKPNKSPRLNKLAK